MRNTPDEAARREALGKAAAGLEDVLASVREDARAYAAIAAAIAFVEVAVERLGGPGRSAATGPPNSVPPDRGRGAP